MGVAPGCARLFTRGGRPHRSAPLVGCQAMACSRACADDGGSRSTSTLIWTPCALPNSAFPSTAAKMGQSCSLEPGRTSLGPQANSKPKSPPRGPSGSCAGAVTGHRRRSAGSWCSRPDGSDAFRGRLLGACRPAGDHPAPVSASPEDQARRPHRPQPRLPTDSATTTA